MREACPPFRFLGKQDSTKIPIKPCSQFFTPCFAHKWRGAGSTQASWGNLSRSRHRASATPPLSILHTSWAADTPRQQAGWKKTVLHLPVTAVHRVVSVRAHVGLCMCTGQPPKYFLISLVKEQEGPLPVGAAEGVFLPDGHVLQGGDPLPPSLSSP